MAYDDLRKGRGSIPGQIYFITTVTANREPLFRCLYTGRLIVDEMRRSEIEGRLSYIGLGIDAGSSALAGSLRERRRIISSGQNLQGIVGAACK